MTEWLYVLVLGQHDVLHPRPSWPRRKCKKFSKLRFTPLSPQPAVCTCKASTSGWYTCVPSARYDYLCTVAHTSFIPMVYAAHHLQSAWCPSVPYLEPDTPLKSVLCGWSRGTCNQMDYDTTTVSLEAALRSPSVVLSSQALSNAANERCRMMVYYQTCQWRNRTWASERTGTCYSSISYRSQDNEPILACPMKGFTWSRPSCGVHKADKDEASTDTHLQSLTCLTGSRQLPPCITFSLQDIHYQRRTPRT